MGMFSLQRTLTIGYLGQHPTRAGLVVASIALGVAVLVATQALKQSLGRAADELCAVIRERFEKAQ